MEARVREFLAAHSLLDSSDRVAVAFSGGADSACLLVLLRTIHPDTSAIYVNHHLRGEESNREEHFVVDFCKARGIPLFVEHIRWKRKSSNLEETARKRRYLHLSKVAAEHCFQKVALAHHQDDLAETFLQRLLRGTGPRGLAGPQPKRGIFIRPLLTLTRHEILEFLEQQQIPFFTDTSNFDPRFLRNRIRHDLLPYLERGYNPKIRVALTKAALWIGEQNLLVEELLQPLKSLISKENRHVRIEKKKLQKLSVPLQKALLRIGLLEADPGFRPDAAVFERLLAFLTTEETMELPGFLMVESGRDAIVFRTKTGPAGLYEIEVPGAGSYDFLPGNSVLIFSLLEDFGFTKDREVAFVDADLAAFPLRVRNWKRGDIFRPLGMKGTRKLSDFWIDLKVPRSDRKRVPLIFKDDNLVWVAGYRLSEDFKITDSSRRVLKIELKKSHV